jgi:hypothetical protein
MVGAQTAQRLMTKSSRILQEKSGSGNAVAVTGLCVENDYIFTMTILTAGIPSWSMMDPVGVSIASFASKDSKAVRLTKSR